MKCVNIRDILIQHKRKESGRVLSSSFLEKGRLLTQFFLSFILYIKVEILYYFAVEKIQKL